MVSVVRPASSSPEQAASSTKVMATAAAGLTPASLAQALPTIGAAGRARSAPVSSGRCSEAA
jgi:hypothetical protein